ncbi:MAG: hypothetical protein HYT62_04865 [Candidatus Yanofskybacteria bacterium]|nr:hypothetical protein [Candidatus Yanofskybacteria bacterium]
MDSFLLIVDSFGTVLFLARTYWWVYLPIFLFFIAQMSFQNYTRFQYLLSLKWVLLELKVPKEVKRSPKAMEQVFAGLHAVLAKIKWHEKIFKGKVQDWYSLELVGANGETHIYVRIREEYKNLLESQIYAQYPGAEIIEVPDYMNELVSSLPDERYDLQGAELMLNKEDAYPIRTYPEFEEKSPGKDEDIKRIDPLASMAELLSTLHAGERICVQILISPANDDWIKRGQAVIDKIMGKESVAQSGFLSDAVFAIDKAISNIGPAPADGIDKKPEKKEEKKKVDLSPGKQDVLKAIEKSFDKLGFWTGIRFIYVAPRESFHKAHLASIVGTFRQYSSQNLNGFKVNTKSTTSAKWPFKKSKEFQKKIAILQKYRERKFHIKSLVKYVLNIEELATIYHFPDIGVKSPLLPRVEAKKGEPPVGLPLS